MGHIVEKISRKKSAPRCPRCKIGRVFSPKNDLVDIGRKLWKVGKKIVDIGRNFFNNVKIV